MNPDEAEARSLRAQLHKAAAVLAADRTGAGAGDDGLLRYLGYHDGDAAQRDGRARILRAAAALRRMFLLPVPDAPGLVFFGGEADPAVLDAAFTGLPVASLAGSGLSPQRAFESCVGEGVEYLSQFAPGDARIERASFAALRRDMDTATAGFVGSVLPVCGVADQQPIAWCPVTRLADGGEAWYPAALCYRPATGRPDFLPPLKLSTGCAAGVSRESATLRAVLELVERDALALWWRGGQPARPVPPDSEAAQAAIDLLQHLRGDRVERRCRLLDLTTDLEVPVVAAVSARDDGFGFARGFAARFSLAEAATAAIFEMCQSELGLHLVETKRKEAGEAALNDNDRLQWRRATEISIDVCRLLRPEGSPRRPAPPPPVDPAEALHHLVNRLAASGVSGFRLDLTRPEFAVPVVRVVIPGLQLEPCAVIGQRLAQVIARTGGGAAHTGGLPLLQ